MRRRTASQCFASLVLLLLMTLSFVSEGASTDGDRQAAKQKHWDQAVKALKGRHAAEKAKKEGREPPKVKKECNVSNPEEGCNDKEKAYIDKMKTKTAKERQAQLDRLDKMKGGSMTPDLKLWLMQRLHILEELKAQIKCNVSNPQDGCTDKEKAYIDKMKAKTAEERQAELDRLDKMKGGTMKADSKLWVMQRLRILEELKEGFKEEL